MGDKLLFFVRHGEADFNLLDRVNAHPDVSNDLTATGREQAACCSAELTQAGIEVIYCSEFPRARQTAEIIGRRLAAPIVVDRLINETGAFAFEGRRTAAWHEAQEPDRLTAAVPGCEPFAQMKQRLATFLEKLSQVPQRRIAVVSHEEPIQIMAGILAGVPDEVAKRRAISHCYPISMRLPVAHG